MDDNVKTGVLRVFDDMEFVYIEPGEFNMGSPASESGRFLYEDLHKVIISTGFWLGRYTVTWKQWKAVMGKELRSWREEDDYPVNGISWNKIQEFIIKLNQKKCNRELDSEQVWTKRVQGCYRLPTEAEWEYACRAGTSTVYSWGNVFDKVKANGSESALSAFFRNFYASAVAPGSYSPNNWGLYDMHGNIWEWCLDWFDEEFYRRCGSCRADPVNLTPALYRVARGGSWENAPAELRAAVRAVFSPDRGFDHEGFRLVFTA